MVSIKDVAREAGVAISTVSKVLNHYPNVSEATRDKVMETVERLGFVPNAVAASLSSKKAGRVALLIRLNQQTQAKDEIDMQYLSGAIRRAQELQLDVITVFYSMIQDMNLEEMTRYFTAQNIHGIIIYGMSERDKVLHKLIESGVFRIVAVDAPMVNATTSSVGVDYEKAQMDVARKTIRENKCKKILYIAGSKESYGTVSQLEGMEKLCDKMKLTMNVYYGNFSELRARELTMRYAARKDAVVCGSDLMAIGAMKALIDMDIFRPVCGFDGIILMGYVGKQMNTVKQNFAGVSEAAMSELYELMNGGSGRRIVTPHELVRMKYTDIIC